MEMKVGELARRTGLTVRTLHHYDELGLLRPARRTVAGHRMYRAAEVRRLQHIVSLRHLGLPLDEIRECLDRPELSLERTIELQIDRLDQELERAGRLKRRLEWLHTRLRSAEDVSVDDLTQTMEGMMEYEKHYTSEQLDQLAKRGDDVGASRIREAREEWGRLFEAFANAMENGLDPSDPEVQVLARRSAALIEEFTGGDPAILESLTAMYRARGADDVMASHGVRLAPGVWTYMQAARDACEEEG